MRERSNGVPFKAALEILIAVLMGFNAMKYFAFGLWKMEVEYNTGLMNNKNWIINGMAYWKSLYFTLRAAKKDPSPKVVRTVKITDTGK